MVVFNSQKGMELPWTCVDFTLTHVGFLREYLALEFGGHLERAVDLEWVLDDLIFLLLFVGNDFVPSLPSVSIRSNSLHLLFQLYKSLAMQNCKFNQNGELDWSKIL